jgi:hypothetical protein
MKPPPFPEGGGKRISKETANHSSDSAPPPQDQRDLATAATALARQARAMVIESLGRAMTPEQRGRVLHAMYAGAPVAVAIQLSPPRNVSVQLGGQTIALVVFDETVQ